jgi:hypothetical protein
MDIKAVDRCRSGLDMADYTGSKDRRLRIAVWAPARAKAQSHTNVSACETNMEPKVTDVGWTISAAKVIVIVNI